MSDFDAADCLARYRSLVRDRPDQFVNPPGDIYEILLDDDRIERARREARTARQAERLSSDDTRVGVLAVDPYLLILRDAVRFADGSYGLYNRLLVPGGAAILPLLAGSIVLLHRFRHGTRQWHFEAPRGAFSGSGTRAEEAERELFEEIGARPIELIDVGLLHATTGIFNEEHQLYVARIAAIGTPDRHEAITSLKVLSIPEVAAMIASGTISDGPTIALFLRAQLRGLLT